MQTLLVEYNVISYDNGLLMEAADTSKPLILKDVVLQRADHKNQNGRVYPKEILAREAMTYKNNFVSQRRALGELDHPESPVVNLKNVCCNVTDLWFEGQDVVGNIEILLFVNLSRTISDWVFHPVVWVLLDQLEKILSKLVMTLH